MEDFVLHSIPGSPFGRTVLATMAEKGVRPRFRRVDPAELRSEAYHLLHPFGRVPVLEHGDFVLYETQAIIRYLDRILPDPALTPAAPRAAARMDQVMSVSDWYLFHGVANVIGFQRIVGPRLLGLPTDEAAVAAATAKAHPVMDELNRLLGELAYFTGPDLSLADLVVACQLDFLAHTPEWASLSRPSLAAWLERMRARPSMQATTWEQVRAMAEAA